MKMTLKARLSAVIGFLVLISITIGLLGLYGISQSNEGLRTVYEDRTVALEQISRVDRLLVRNRLALSEALRETDAKVIKNHTDLIEKNIAEIVSTLGEYMATSLTPEEKITADRFSIDRAKLTNEGMKPALAALKEGKIEIAEKQEKLIQSLVPPVTDGINALRQIQVDTAKKEYDSAKTRYAVFSTILPSSIAFSAIIATLLGFFLVRNIYRQLGGEPEYTAQIVHAIAAGDLTVVVATKKNDKQSLLFSMQTMQQNLARTVGEIRQSTDTIATASGQIASGNLDLSSRTEEQASSLEETASAMEELTSTVKQNADNARQANQLAASASEVATVGGNIVSQVVETMGTIHESSRQIVDIISVIDGIAFQTNILALNAAVEAARAGGQGRGFAVVASEVRALAQRSAAAAKEIKTLIDNSVTQVGIGSKLVEQTGNTMSEVVDSVKRVSDIVAEISSASQEQSEGIEQVNLAITQMDEVTQQNAALVEEAAAAAQSMKEQATKLSDVVRIFKLETNQVVLAHPAASRKRTIDITPVASKLIKTPARIVAKATAKDDVNSWEQF